MLRRDPHVDLVSFFILRTESDEQPWNRNDLSLIPFPTYEIFEEQLRSFDLVIFQNFNYAAYGVEPFLSNVRDYVEGGGALAMVGGDLSFTSGGYGATALRDVLPVELPPTPPPMTGASDADLSLCLGDARGRDLKIEILAQSRIDQVAQPVVLEHIPPGLIAEGGRVGGIIRRRAAERGRKLDDRPLEGLTDRTRGGGRRQQEDGEAFHFTRSHRSARAPSLRAAALVCVTVTRSTDGAGRKGCRPREPARAGYWCGRACCGSRRTGCGVDPA